MGLYTISCPSCSISFLWFSGDVSDQHCDSCKEKSKPKEITVFVDGVDWQHEIGEASDGNKIYPDIESLKKYSRCWAGCGVVKCKIVFEEWVVEQNFEDMFKNSSQGYTLEELKTNGDVLKLESKLKHLEYLENQVKNISRSVEELKNKIEKEKTNVIE